MSWILLSIPFYCGEKWGFTTFSTLLTVITCEGGHVLYGLQGWDKGWGEPTFVQGWPHSGLMICHLDCLLKSLRELCKYYRCLSQFNHHLWGWCSAILHFKSVLVSELCPTLCDPIDFRPPGSSVHGILQARILERVAIPFSRGSSQPRHQTSVSFIAGIFFTSWATREDLLTFMYYLFIFIYF